MQLPIPSLVRLTRPNRSFRRQIAAWLPLGGFRVVQAMPDDGFHAQRRRPAPAARRPARL